MAELTILNITMFIILVNISTKNNDRVAVLLQLQMGLIFRTGLPSTNNTGFYKIAVENTNTEGMRG